MDRRIQLLTQFAFLCLCIVGIALGVRSLARPTPVLVTGGIRSIEPEAQRRPGPPTTYKVGDSITLTNVDFKRADRTLLLVVRKGCRFCDESMPFYKRLGDDPTLAKRTQFVVVAPDDELVSREELAKQQVRVDQIVTKSLTALRVQGTPTAILVAKTGRIERIMVGRLDETQQQELMSALNAPVRQ